MNDIHELEPLVGRWGFDGKIQEDLQLQRGKVVKASGAAALGDVSIEWAIPDAALLCKWGVDFGSGHSKSFVAIVGVDPKTKRVVGTAFASDGGHVHQEWDRRGQSFVVVNSGFSFEGAPFQSQFIFTPSGNSLKWNSSQRAKNGQTMPDGPEYTLARVKALH